MGQQFKQEFYKRMVVGGKEFYLFKNMESFDSKKWKLAFLSVYENRDATGFIVESGAGISETRMENQIKKYLEKKYPSQSFEYEKHTGHGKPNWGQ